MADKNSEGKNPEPKRKFSQKQYDFLLEYSKKGKEGIEEWNKWRDENPGEEILLEDANLSEAHLENANLWRAHLENANLSEAHLENANLWRVHLENAKLGRARLENANLLEAHLENAKLPYAHLENAKFLEAHVENANLPYAHLENAILWRVHLENANLGRARLENAILLEAHLENAIFEAASVDGSTLIWKCYVDRKTDFRGVPLENCRIDAGTKTLLQYNNRRLNWEDWYRKGAWVSQILKRVCIKPFWWTSDYGHRTSRIIATFLLLALLFSVVYWFCPGYVTVMVSNRPEQLSSFWHALYFSVVTMTTLGFGDIAADPESPLGQTLLMVQVIMGYVLLGALITRFAVLFTAGGPSARFVKRTFKEWCKDKKEDFKKSLRAIEEDLERW